MKTWILIIPIALILLVPDEMSSQDIAVFDEEIPLKIHLEFGRKALLEITNDSTYMPTVVRVVSDSTEFIFEGQIRSRGNFRKKNCFYIPLKVKLPSDTTIDTPLEGLNKFKLVLPCLVEKGNDDATVKEFIAYKIYERLMPYYFKTRLADIQWTDTDGNRSRTYEVRGFLLEDVDALALRYDAQEVKRRIPALQQCDSTSVGVAYFNYLIANTDFSTRMRHNIKLLFKDGRVLPIPFDFDLSGLVNASYAEVSGGQYLSKRIYEVTQRAYKGYLRDEETMQHTRQHFLERKEDVMSTVTYYEKYLENSRAGKTMRVFLSEFYKIYEDDKRFERLILRHARE